MRIGSYYIGEEPPELTQRSAEDAKLSRGDRKRKRDAERRFQMKLQLEDEINAVFHNRSGKLKP